MQKMQRMQKFEECKDCLECQDCRGCHDCQITENELVRLLKTFKIWLFEKIDGCFGNFFRFAKGGKIVYQMVFPKNSFSALVLMLSLAKNRTSNVGKNRKNDKEKVPFREKIVYLFLEAFF